MRRHLLALFWRLERCIATGTRSTQYRYAEQLESLLFPGASWLDIGCGRAILPDWIPSQDRLLVRAGTVAGLDYDYRSLKKHRQIHNLAAGDSVHLPFREGSFDLVTANMVIEHVAHPAAVLNEIKRVLRPGGRFLFHTPNSRFYLTAIAAKIPQAVKNRIVELTEGRSDEDIFPTLYRMNTLEQIEGYASQTGFRIVSCDSLNSSNAGLIMLGPVVLIDLLVKRVTAASPSLARFRSNFVVVFEKVGKENPLADVPAPAVARL